LPDGPAFLNQLTKHLTPVEWGGTQDYPLPKNYTIFGQVTGQTDLQVLDKIASVPVKASPSGEPSVPTQEVKITGVDISEK
jgi:cyclophilin family peptidyl-prolyl cis-trans isomerase